MNAPAERCLWGQAARLDGRSQALIDRNQGVDVKVGVPMGREGKLGKGRGGEEYQLDLLSFYYSPHRA